MNRTLALVVLLIASSAESAGFGRGGGLTCPRGYVGGGLTPCTLAPRAYFEFAPLDGAGMGTACACAAVTGAQGEVLSFARASTGSCLKWSATSAANGDMVLCGADLPRATPGGDGSGPLGLLVESSRTNVVPRSQEIDDGAFGDFTANGAAAPVLNGSDATAAPDGTVTAEDYTFAATAATQASARAIAVLTAAAYSAQIWIRGVSGGGSMDLCLQTSGVPTATCATCAFVSTAWTQCRVENVTAAAVGQVFVGNMTYLNGGTTRASNRVYIWGLDAELGAYVTSYVPTAGAPATRAAESVYFAKIFPPANVGSIAVTVASMGAFAYNLPAATSTAWPPPPTGADTLALFSPGTVGATFECYSGNTVAGVFVTSAVAPGPTPWRGWCASGTTVTGAVGGTAMTAAGPLTGAFATANYLTIGSSGLYFFDGVVKQICRDPGVMRCR